MNKTIYAMLALAVSFTACTRFAEDDKISFAEAVAPEVSATVVDDNTVSISVTAKEGNTYFSFALIEGESKTLNASTLLSGGYAKSALISAVKNVEDVAFLSLTVDGLSPNTAYTLYAVASNSQGVVSPVASASVVTTDSTAPVLLDDDIEVGEKDGVLQFALPFDDPVALGSGAVTAHFFAKYGSLDADKNLVEYKSVELPADSMSVEEKYLVVNVPASEYIPGAIVAITYPEGVVVNALGAKCAASPAAVVSKASGKVTTAAIAASYKAATFTLSRKGSEADAPEYFSDWTELVMTAASDGAYPLAGVASKTGVSVAVSNGKGRVVTYSASSFNKTDEKNIGIELDEDPGYGTSISFTVAAGTFVDIFGNGNAEFSAADAYYCSYGYTVEDVIGTYEVSGVNAITGASVSYNMTIVASDDEEYGNVMITDFLGFAGKLYCEFNGDSGELLMYEYDIFAGSKDSGYCIYFVGDGDKTFSFVDGNITGDGYICVAVVAGGKLTGYAKDANGNNVVVTKFKAVRK